VRHFHFFWCAAARENSSENSYKEDLMQYDLVFEGGGAKGMSFVGALQELEARGHTHGRLLGTSAGAIAATFTAAGYGTQEMLEALTEKDAEGRPVFMSFLSLGKRCAIAPRPRCWRRLTFPFYLRW
jgi:predicted acylesterase/phospholipase RssA